MPMPDPPHPVVSARDVALGARTLAAIDAWYASGAGTICPPDHLLCRLLLDLGFDAVVYAYRRADGPVADR